MSIVDVDESIDASGHEHPASGQTETARRRILVYGMNYAPEFAGVGKYTGEIAEHFSAEGADVQVITTPPHYPGWKVKVGYRNRYRTSIENNVRVIRCPLLLREKMQGFWRLLAPLTFALSSAPIVFWQILTRRPHVVFLVEPTLLAAPVALLASKLVGARTILQVQDLEVDAAFAVGHLASKKTLKRIGYAFERFCLKHLDHVVTISNRMADKLAEKGVDRQRLQVIRNWVDLDNIYPLEGPSRYRGELGYKDDDFIVLYSGNIGAKQGLSVLLEAANLLVDQKSIRFVIAGEGPAKQDLVSRYGHLPNVRFLPFQPQARLNEFLSLADLHALTQDADAADLVLPSKLGGMLASGKRVLVTAAPGTELADFVYGAATVVPPGDAEALCSAIKLLAAHQDDAARVVTAATKAQLLSKTGGVAIFTALLVLGSVRNITGLDAASQRIAKQ
ncbi:WcaI family glycosyltransferase [Pannonibacter sp. P2PFMT1]|uniref:WcaI family glycosyltransferase n=1 Tax=Pannonibacter sp. P2PFMT1 TaxID=2003582 RepID=UPI0016485CCB|nr:WcaI family glycosyltransferase [Pannonibacter sp. P2PFMT1]